MPATRGSTRPRFSVVVPVYNAMRHLEPSVASLERAVRGYGDADLILVDNGSTDGSYEFLRERYSQAATVCRESGSVGAVRNRGASLATGDVLAFVDADCVVPCDYLERAAAVLAQTHADATGSMVSVPERPHWIEQTWYAMHQREAEGPVRHLNSGNFVVSRHAFEAVGGFDPTLASGEDAELSLRLLRAGFVIHASARVSAIHLGFPKTLRQFARQQLWHGLGMFGTFRQSAFDLPVLMTALHGLLIVAALAVLVWAGKVSTTRILGSAALCLTVPTATVAFRAAQTRRLRRPLRSVLLYWVYYAARLAATLLILADRDPRHSRDLERAGSRH